MDVHEYQAKEMLAKFGVAVPRGAVAHTPEQAVYAATELGGSSWVVKAQIHAGGRSQAGGIKMCGTYHDVRKNAADLLGKRLVTAQTGPDGKLIQRVYVEQEEKFEREFYFSFVLDRKTERINIRCSKHGGVNVEDLFKKYPEDIILLVCEPAFGLQPFQARELAFKLGLNMNQVSRAVQCIMGAYRCFRDLDATFLEINPLVLTADDRMIALDAKLSIDDNALFRQAAVGAMHDPSQEDPREAQAEQNNLNFIGLDGEIGCVVNGAGLAMATMDMIELAGGTPANFLDVGGGATPDRMVTAIRLVLGDKNVKAVLINIFAGINRCDLIAEGVVQAFAELKPEVPFIVRLAGNHVEEGRKILADSGLPVIVATTLADAAHKAVAAIKG